MGDFWRLLAIWRFWDGRMEPDRVGATIFDVFFVHWVRTVVRERFEGDAAGLLAGGEAGLAARLLEDDALGWFGSGRRAEAIRGAMGSALDYLANRLGPDMNGWAWGRLHVMPLRHILSGRGDLGRLLDAAGEPVKGDMTTVCNTGQGGSFEARWGATIASSPTLAIRCRRYGPSMPPANRVIPAVRTTPISSRNGPTAAIMRCR